MSAGSSFLANEPCVLWPVVSQLAKNLICHSALLQACAAFDSGALDPAFRAVGLSLDNLLRRIEEELPAAKLADSLPGPIPEILPPEWAVVIEGPGFRDMRNRYATLAEAEYAAELLECSLKSDSTTRSGP